MSNYTSQPLQPTAEGPNVPQQMQKREYGGLETGAPGHTPVPQPHNLHPNASKPLGGGFDKDQTFGRTSDDSYGTGMTGSGANTYGTTPTDTFGRDKTDRDDMSGNIYGTMGGNTFDKTERERDTSGNTYGTQGTGTGFGGNMGTASDTYGTTGGNTFNKTDRERDTSGNTYGTTTGSGTGAGMYGGNAFDKTERERETSGNTYGTQGTSTGNMGAGSDTFGTNTYDSTTTGARSGAGTGPTTYGTTGEFSERGTYGTAMGTDTNKHDTTGARSGMDAYGTGTTTGDYDRNKTDSASRTYGGTTTGAGMGAGTYGTGATTGDKYDTTTGKTGFGSDTYGTGNGTGKTFGTGSGGNTVLNVDAPDLKTIRITGEGIGYTLRTTWENRNELVTIHRDDAGTDKDVTSGTRTAYDASDVPAQVETHQHKHGQEHEHKHQQQQQSQQQQFQQQQQGTTGEPFVAQVEVHQIRASKLSIKGGPQIKLKDWLGGRGTNVRKFENNGDIYEWRREIEGLHHKMELFKSSGSDTRLAWAEKVPRTTTATDEPHEPGRPPLPANDAKAQLTLTPEAMPMMDVVVVSFLLVDRETRNDPLH